MPRIASIQFALAIGPGGTLVDVSDDVRLVDGIEYSYGRENQFRTLSPGQIKINLDNSSGAYTPSSSARPTTDTLAEGAQAVLKVGDRLVECFVAQMQTVLPDGLPSHAFVELLLEDTMGPLARFTLADDWYTNLIVGSDPVALYSMGDAEGSQTAVDVSGQQRGPLFFTAGTLEFGYDQDGRSSLRLVTAAGTSGRARSGASFTPTYTRGDVLTVRITPLSAAGDLTISAPESSTIMNTLIMSGGSFSADSAGATTASMAYTIGQTYLLQIDPSGLWVDGVLFSGYVGIKAPSGQVGDPHLITYGGAAALDVVISDLAFTQNRPDLLLLPEIAPLTITTGLQLLEACTPQLTLDTLPAELAPDIIDLDPAGQTPFSILEDILEAEQGYAQTTTTGTLTSPTTVVTIRERDRPVSPTITLSARDELSGSPSLVRDIENLVSTVTVTGEQLTVVVTDDTLATRARSAATSIDSVLSERENLVAYAQDRIQRGSNSIINPDSIDVDAMTTPTDRSADLLGLRMGDRALIEDFDETTTALSEWSGWLIGGKETHTVEQSLFSLYLMPVLDEVGVFDTDRFTDDGELLLVSGINAAVTTMSVSTSGARLDTTDEPYYVRIDDEIFEVTNCTSATPQVLTVVRGALGTTAASHSASAAVVSDPETLFAY